MRKIIFSIILSICILSANAQFPLSAGEEGTNAIHKDSSVFIGWATGCNSTRGYMDISNPDNGNASHGDNSSAMGKADGLGVVSLGDGGSAILTFEKPITNGDGWDFAVFENGLSNTFLELAFVEVSSDGVNYFRFPATSNTETTEQVGGFGALDASKINNLAGKYEANYGTPFDLDELTDEIGLDVNNITHVKVIDVVGNIDNNYATYDYYDNMINDPWPTPFPTSGFDLDAVGVIHFSETQSINNYTSNNNIEVYPNPINSGEKLFINFPETKTEDLTVTINDLTGKFICTVDYNFQSNSINIPTEIESGVYLIKVSETNLSSSKKIIIE